MQAGAAVIKTKVTLLELAEQAVVVQVVVLELVFLEPTDLAVAVAVAEAANLVALAEAEW
jgi:hypothetical protein